MSPKAHPADPAPTAEREKPRPSERRKRRVRVPPPDPEKYPNLKANRALDRALHIHRAMEMGVSREQAILDADEHLGPLVPSTPGTRTVRTARSARNARAAEPKPQELPTTRVKGSPRSRTRVKPLR